MAQNPPAGTQRVIPYLYYEDGPAAVDFLCSAFGFEERMRSQRDDGTLMHAEVGYQGNVVMLGTPVDEQGRPRSVKDLPVRHSAVMCYVDDVDAHYRHAKRAGARIDSEPMDQPYGDRLYLAVDPEGQQWYFATHLRDVGPGGG